MARKFANIRITEENRDHNKVFRITEMPASQAEKWAMKAFVALMKGGTEVTPDIEQSGMAGIAFLGKSAITGLSFDDLEPLMDEMFTCVMFVPDLENHPELVIPLVENHIEEPDTRLKLRREVFNLHVDFSKVVALSKLILEATARKGGDS